jgi:hypothetical protein
VKRQAIASSDEGRALLAEEWAAEVANLVVGHFNEEQAQAGLD